MKHFLKLKILLALNIFIIALLLSNCSPVTDTEKSKTSKEVERKEPAEKVVKNLDKIEVDYIKSLKIKSIEKISFDYDKKGKLINREKISTVNYNKNGLAAETIIYNRDSEVESRYDYKYDKLGKRIETSKHSPNGEIEKNILMNTIITETNKIKPLRLKGNLEKYYEYDYDDEGNLTEENWYDSNGGLEYKFEYE